MLSKPKRVRSFGDDEPVGLRIVAAMSGDLLPRQHVPPPAKVDPVVIGRSDPIPIRPTGAAVAGATSTLLKKNNKKAPEEEEEDEDEEEMEEEELSESYTCVTTHVGGKVVRRRVYGSESGGGSVRQYGRSPGLLILESPPVPVPMEDFLSRCYWCRKKLHGLDIFMYRGDEAFCSVECRGEQILSDEHMEKCRSEAPHHLDYSASPYPSPLLFAAGVAAA